MIRSPAGAVARCSRTERQQVSSNSIDRRAQRTRQLLAQALLELGAERGIDDLDVQSLADTAGVGRSTFYAHYADKDDFLARSFERMLDLFEAAEAQADPAKTALAPSRKLFAHIADARDFAQHAARSEAHRAMFVAGELKLRQIVAANIAQRAPHWSELQRTETAIYVAAGLMGLMRWWIDGGLRQTPDAMHATFERLAERAMRDE
jgi:AcrR family transcriptional regulator